MVVATHIFLEFLTRIPGKDFQCDEHIFQMGWFNHQPVVNFAENHQIDPKIWQTCNVMRIHEVPTVL